MNGETPEIVKNPKNEIKKVNNNFEILSTQIFVYKIYSGLEFFGLENVNIPINYHIFCFFFVDKCNKWRKEESLRQQRLLLRLQSQSRHPKHRTDLSNKPCKVINTMTAFIKFPAFSVKVQI